MRGVIALPWRVDGSTWIERYMALVVLVAPRTGAACSANL